MTKGTVPHSTRILVTTLRLEGLEEVSAVVLILVCCQVLLIGRCYWSIEVSKVVQEVIHVSVETSDTLYLIPLDEAMVLLIRTVLVSVISRADIGVV